MFDYVTSQSLTAEKFTQKTEYLIDGFIGKQLITLIYAKGGTGKSWLGMAIAKLCDNIGKSVIYLDYDNPLGALKDREVHQKLIAPSERLHYVQNSVITMTGMEMIRRLELESPKKLKDLVLIIDSLRNLGDIRSDSRAMEIMKSLMRIRDLGATVIALSHVNKDGRNYEGSVNIFNSIDSMYELSGMESAKGYLNFLLTVKKERVVICDQAYRLSVDDLSMIDIDIDQAQLKPEDKAFIDKVKSILKGNDGINKKDLLEAMGCDKRDKTASNRLDKYTDSHWFATVSKRIYTYSLKPTTATTATTA